DYTGPMLDDDLTEALIDMVNATGRHVDGADDGPADEIERLRTDVERLDAALVQQMEDSERLRAALEGVRTSVEQALDRIDRAPVPRTTGVNPVAREYLDEVLAITRECLAMSDTT